MLILPGTKSTLAELEFLRDSRLFDAVRNYAAQGGRVIGICGGLQLLGKRILDPDRVESQQGVGDGLGLLDLDTTLCSDKKTHQVRAQLQPAAAAAGLSWLGELSGYEIHAGETEYGPACRPLLQLSVRSGVPVALYDGAVSADGRIWGSYLHGIFDNDELRHAVLAPLRNGAADRSLPSYDLDHEIDLLADHLQTHLDIEQILGWLTPPRGEA